MRVRYLLDIAYKGTHYAGWQIQPNALAVQEVLEKALHTVLREKIRTHGAGRTDAGVHASQLMVHFDGPESLPGNVLHSLNGTLPADIAVNAIYKPHNPDFHARFDAMSRSYRYQIVLQKSPLWQEVTYWVRQTVDIDTMNEAAECLAHFEDFASFCKAHGNNKTTICQVAHAYWEAEGPLWVFHIQANRFLRGMVRGIVGSLLEVGAGKKTVADFVKMVEARDRSKAGPNIAAQGLTLSEVAYPPNSWEKLK